MNLIGRKHRSEASERSKDYEHGYSDGYCKAERLFSDTIVFQDSYISALERRLKNKPVKIPTAERTAAMTAAHFEIFESRSFRIHSRPSGVREYELAW